MADAKTNRDIPSASQQPIETISILWITAGLGCDGESVALTAATQPRIEDIVMGGLALMVLGAGFAMSHSGVRKTVSAGVASVLPELKGRVGPGLGTIGSDIERYLKLKSM